MDDQAKLGWANLYDSGFGQTGDKPVAGNYTGGAAAELAVYRPSSGTWYFREVGNATVASTQFGAAGDIAVPGNYDGDGVMDFAVFRPSTGQWHILGSMSGYSVLQWGVASDIPTPADFDGDNKTDLAVYRGTSGTWYVLKSSTNFAQWDVKVLGNFGDQPTPADYDGDNKADYSVWRPTTGVWHTIKSSNSSYDYQTLGVAGDTAVSSAYLKQIGGQVSGYDLAQARLSPKNATGGTDLYSRNFSWGTSLVGLSGRSGLGAGFGMSYNSLVWTKSGNEIYFDADTSNISPGFRFGFPTIEPAWYNTVTQKFSYLMVTPTGGRVEFRQIGASQTYETADSSYAQLTTKGAASPNDPVEGVSITIRGTDGTQMSYLWKAGAFRCSRIIDRNGNFITINHDDQGLLRTVTDTLGRVITVEYDTELFPTAIKQTWKNNNGQGSDVVHTWATFSYTTTNNPPINTNFSNLTVVGPPNGTVLKVLEKVTYPDNSFTQFDYNSYGQVFKVRNVAADSPSHVLNYVRTNLESPAANQTDCPRFTETRSWIENFNSGAETVVDNTLLAGSGVTDLDGATVSASLIQVSMQNHPNENITNIYVGESGWKEGLPIRTDDYADGNALVIKRSSWTKWTQDDPNLAYIQNPRAVASKVGDAANVKKTSVEYLPVNQGSPIALYGLVSAVNVYDANQSTVLKRAETDYNLSSIYISKRIIGLPSETRSWGKNDTTQNLEFVSKMTYAYDEENFSQEPNQIIAPVRHDTANYGSTFIVGRGNLTSTTRYDVTGQTASVTSRVRYDIAGSLIAQIDPLNRKVAINYTDNFNTPGNPATFAYPTTLTDPANNSSTVKYRYDIGVNVWAQSPAPAGNTQGKITEREFDSLGRLLKDKVLNLGGAYTRYEYPTNGIQSKVYSTVIDANNNGADTADEVLSESWADGAGRVRQSRTEHPGSTGGYSGSLVEYDILGRVKRSTVPTEINSSWQPAGDDYRLDGQGNVTFLWKSQEYDWMGRVTREINTDGTDRLMSYDGCGCAGGQVTTIKGEVVPGQFLNQWGNPLTMNARRTQKLYADTLGRNYKTEVMNWDGTTPYTTTEQTFNGRDQVVKTKKTDNPLTRPQTSQEVTMAYDGHGRVKTRHYPIEAAQTDTTWIYNTDDSIQQVIDPRGVITNFAYNDPRGLTTQISYIRPSGSNIFSTQNVNFNYDNLGNRTQMTDGSGTKTYSYDQLSQLISESKSFAGLSGSYSLNYNYELSGQLRSITDPFGTVTSYSHDRTGRTAGVGGSGALSLPQYISSISHRAWGAPKQTNYGNGRSLNVSYNTRLQVSRIEMPSVGSANYTYYADGRVKYLENDTQWPADGWGNQWDRSRAYQYDHAGRLISALTGSYARDIGNNLPIGSSEFSWGPYTKSFGYDAFDNMTSNSGNHWLFYEHSYTTTYLDNRNQDSTLQFDALGNIVISGSRGFGYDAAGELVYQYWPSTLYLRRDGDGNLTKTDHLQYEPTPTITYFLNSTVLGGKAVTELNQSGQKVAGNVYSEGQRIARISNDYLGTFMTHSDPVNTIRWSTASDGAVFPWGGVTDQDPMGVDIDTPDPTPFAPRRWFPLYVGSSFDRDITYDREIGTCNVDGFSTRCSQAIGMLNSGTAVQCPNNDCSPIRVEGEWRFFRAYGDGYQGYSPLGAIYEGGGRWFRYQKDASDNNPRSRDPNSRPRKVRPESGNYNTRLSVSPILVNTSPDLGKLQDAINSCAETWFGVTVTSVKWSGNGIDGQIDFTVMNGGTVPSLDSSNSTFSQVRNFSIANVTSSFSSAQTGNNGFAVGLRGYYGIYSYSGSKYGRQGVLQTNTTFTVSDRETGFSEGQIFEGRGLGISGFIHTQVHETGNALRTITGKPETLPDDYVSGDGKTRHRYTDRDSGQGFENCVLVDYKARLTSK